MTFSTQEWEDKVKNKPKSAERILQSRCVVIMGAGTYTGLPGFKAKDVPKPKDISVMDQNLSHSEIQERIKQQREYGQKVRAELRTPEQETISQILALLKLDEKCEREVNDLTRRNASSSASKEGTKMCAVDTLSNLFNDPPTKAVNFLVLNGSHDAVPDEIRYIRLSTLNWLVF
ncbi:hypothetical protein SISNIDRAFT_483841 [Sistotremastrum niveocremeum HHB9708]|uniref:Uncharacterized protein n=1 Tax=Sistotremastrum niveocremeum HHB9708 TaxID=1314777 RepID=A0A164X426_9AGAM|nr:hypothetical protein SISNIDRAFT_483841 [Sistotremastrum niveocremeum HHB9708]